jgi:DNA-binding NarL/FixJ family response regulator
MAKSILVVDNNPILRRTLRHILVGNHLNVCGEAVDGCDAIVKAHELHPDLVVLDLSMPGLDGLQTAKVLKRLMPEVQLVLYSVYGQDPFLERESRALGVDAVISKADGMKSLIHALESLGGTA